MDEIIAKCVKEIWANYDKDNNGELDMEEMRPFVTETLEALDPGVGFEEDAYKECFRTFDVDGSGKVSKNEMAAFMKNLIVGLE